MCAARHGLTFFTSEILSRRVKIALSWKQRKSAEPAIRHSLRRMFRSWTMDETTSLGRKRFGWHVSWRDDQFCITACWIDPKRKLVFQPSISGCYISFREGIVYIQPTFCCFPALAILITNLLSFTLPSDVNILVWIALGFPVFLSKRVLQCIKQMEAL